MIFTAISESICVVVCVVFSFFFRSLHLFICLALPLLVLPFLFWWGGALSLLLVTFLVVGHVRWPLFLFFYFWNLVAVRGYSPCVAACPGNFVAVRGYSPCVAACPGVTFFFVGLAGVHMVCVSLFTLPQGRSHNTKQAISQEQ